MRRYAAFLRGVGPTNAQMPKLKNAFEQAGFTDVETLLTSGNVLFTAGKASVELLQQTAEAAMLKSLGTTFLTIVRPVEGLRALLESDPYKEFRLAPDAKRVVTFLRDVPSKPPKLPIEKDGARILMFRSREAFTVYVPNAKGPVFMKLIDTTFGKAQTTRTWQTLEKVAR